MSTVDGASVFVNAAYRNVAVVGHCSNWFGGVRAFGFWAA
ncbi:hypothetical protein COPR103792_04500 [Corynebacterium propinquum]